MARPPLERVTTAAGQQRRQADYLSALALGPDRPTRRRAFAPINEPADH
jgi:hypothetical protein